MKTVFLLFISSLISLVTNFNLCNKSALGYEGRREIHARIIKRNVYSPVSVNLLGVCAGKFVCFQPAVCVLVISALCAEFHAPAALSVLQSQKNTSSHCDHTPMNSQTHKQGSETHSATETHRFFFLPLLFFFLLQVSQCRPTRLVSVSKCVLAFFSLACDDECSGLLISDMDRLHRIIADVTLTTPLPPPYKVLYRFENMTEELKVKTIFSIMFLSKVMNSCL